MRNFKRITSALAALTLAACAVAPMSFTVANAATITIENADTDKGDHTYEAYQIFKGSVDSDGRMGDIEWGSGVTVATDDAEATKLYRELNEKGFKFVEKTIIDGKKEAFDAAYAEWKSSQTSGADTSEEAFMKTIEATNEYLEVNPRQAENAAEVASILAGLGEDDPKLQEFADVIAEKYLTDEKKTSDKSGIITVDHGYYLVQDADGSPDLSEPSGDNSGAKTRYILKVAKEGNVTVTSKAAAPTVDKTVENDSSNSTPWGDTADHQLFESFQFKLTATIPKDANFSAYDAYKVVFNDTMSVGVVWEELVSVKVIAGNDGESVPVKDGTNGGYTLEGVTADEESGGDAETTWSITIDDVFKFLGSSKDTFDFASTDIKVEVVYKAHLNEKAKAVKENGLYDNTKTNNNKVSLQYSNDPNATGGGTLGETPEDYVWVFTYDTGTTKTDGSTGNPLAGATFELRKGSATGPAIRMIWDSTLNDPAGAWRPAKDANEEGASTSIETKSNGSLNFYGLDAGTYYWVETAAPAGYNKAEPFEIVITPTLTEDNTGASARLTFTPDSNLTGNEIINNKGHKLPSTGGIGTTIFYLGGGALVAVAGVMLITKKRMGKTEK